MEDQLSMSFALIICVFIVCWSPLIINALFAIYLDIHISRNFLLALVSLSCLSSVINPVLYAYKMKDFRISAKLVLKFLFCFNETKRKYVFSRQLSKSNILL